MRDTRTSVQVIILQPNEWIVVALGKEMGVKLATYPTEAEANECAQRIEEALAA